MVYLEVSVSPRLDNTLSLPSIGSLQGNIKWALQFMAWPPPPNPKQASMAPKTDSAGASST
uniref:Uncharacterized protein n=1 Tax=Magnetococcus massalia (strain MO-1) TaxID=451514 RepID=A0A1S7LDV9_MAGMO|nr:protein of unknown function [Candidatus Magnetococcus massalia]